MTDQCQHKRFLQEGYREPEKECVKKCEGKCARKCDAEVFRLLTQSEVSDD